MLILVSTYAFTALIRYLYKYLQNILILGGMSGLKKILPEFVGMRPKQLKRKKSGKLVRNWQNRQGYVYQVEFYGSFRCIVVARFFNAA